MKLYFTKIMSFFLAVFILFSTSSFTVNIHFCYNQLVDMAFFSKAEICKDKVQNKDNIYTQRTSIKEKDCCNNRTFVKKGDNIFKKSNIISEVDSLVSFNMFNYTDLFKGLEENVIPMKSYKPPLIYDDIQILHQIYLI